MIFLARKACGSVWSVSGAAHDDVVDDDDDDEDDEDDEDEDDEDEDEADQFLSKNGPSRVCQ